MTRYVATILLALALASCGIKSKVDAPATSTAKTEDKNIANPSQPPTPLGQ